MGNLFALLIVTPITNILLAIYNFLLALNIPSPLGFAIILLTVVIRFVLYPLTASQLQASKNMQKVAPHVNKLKEKHKGDAKKLQTATMALYKEHGINPAAGCLPVLIQFPVIIGLYNVLQHLVAIKPQEAMQTVNKIAYAPFLQLKAPWDPLFLGLPLGKMPADLLNATGYLILLVPILTGLFQFIQSKMMVPPAPLVKPKKSAEPDFASALQTQTLYFLPLMIAFFSFRFPIGLSLYWNTFTIFGIIQQYKMHGFGGLEGIIKYLPTGKKKK